MHDTADADPRRTVLVFEDEVLVAMMVEDVLVEAGFRAVSALGRRGGGLHDPGPGAAPSEAPHAAVVDLRLGPGLDGRDVLRRLRERHPSMPAVVMTGYDPLSPEADLRGLGGPTVRLLKPFDCDAFLQELLGVMDGAARAAVPQRRRATDLPAELPALAVA